MSNVKEKLIDLLQNKTDNQAKLFNDLFSIYRESDNKNLMMEMSLNRCGYSKSSLDNLEYDLKQMHDVSDADLYLKPEVKVISLFNELPQFVLDMTEDQLTDWARTDCVGVGVGLDEVCKIAINEGNEFIASILVNESALIAKEKVTQINVNSDANQNQDLPEINTVGGLREEFPFLSDKNCPDEFKILAADKLTAYNLYKDTKEKISSADPEKTSDEVFASLGEVATTAYAENQNIYKEFNHYKDTGEILGKHPIFKRLALQREIDSMTNDALIKFKNSSAKYFSTNKTDLVDATKKKDVAKIELINNRVLERKEKLALVNKKLGIEK